MATALKLRSDIKKLKKGLEAKGVSASLKEKLKSQLKKAEDELESLKKTGKAPKKSSVAGTKVALTALQKLIQRKKYGVYQGAGVDLKKDAGEGALATGRRESKGLKSNQHGDKSDNKGNVYYEYRPNRLDVKQPKKKQSYPKLEDGGETSTKKFNTQYNVGKAKYVINYHDGKKTHKDGSPFYDLATFKNMKDFMAYKKKLKSEGYKEYKDGGYMADGGDLSSIKEQYLQNEDENAHSENVVLLAKHFGTKEDLTKAKEILALHEKEGSLSSENGKKRQELHLKLIKKATKEMAKQGIEFEKGGYMADGGMMAKGGEFEVGDMVELKSGQKAKVIRVEESWISVQTSNNMLKDVYKEDVKKLADGGMMADGGKIEVGDKVKYKNAKYHATVIEVVDDAQIPYAKIEYSDGRSAKAYLEDLQKVQLAMAKEYVNPNYMDDGGYMADGGQTQGKNGYVAFYKGKRIEVYADTMYQAQLKAAKIFNAKKSYEVNVVLAEIDGKQYYNSTMADGGMLLHGFNEGDTILRIYKGYGIVENKNNGVIEVLNPNKGTRFIIDLDDSKSSGMRKSMGMSKAEQIESAKKYIDYLNENLPDTFGEKFQYHEEGKMALGGNVMSTTHRLSK